jgi:hypothetical protein
MPAFPFLVLPLFDLLVSKIRENRARVTEILRY